MKKIFSFLLISILLFGCHPGNPKDAAENFFTALQQKNYDQAKRYATKESANVLNMIAMFSHNGDAVSSTGKFIISNVIINGNDATAEVKPDDQVIGMTIKLKKEDGDWKVAFDMNSIMKMAGEVPENEGAGIHPDKENTIDSIKKGMEEANKVFDSASKELQQSTH